MNIQPNRRDPLRIVAVVAMAAAAGLAAGQGMQEHALPAAPAAQPADTARARLAAAEFVCNILHDQETGASMPHQGVEHTYLWSLRRMEAQRRVDAARGGAGSRTAAIDAHLQRMRAMAQGLAEAGKSGVLSRFDTASVDYYVAEAEDMLAQAR
ncbi:MAG: hypothetical protein K2Q09_05355 [Phycisphaerales bacterium]|nr:hypothetical protein [Chloroflexota bacterium]MBY0308148.1 hypothetical protein [Phycisphaerales bacterium]